MKRSFVLNCYDLWLPKLMVIVWASWFIAAFILPFTYEGGTWLGAGLISLMYVVLTTSASLVINSLVHASNIVATRPLRCVLGVKRYALLGLLGFGLLAYDRLFAQGVTLFEGLAAARYEWAALGEVRAGVSSVYSVLGNLLWAFAYVPIVYGYLYYESLRAQRKSPLLPFALGVVAIVAVSALNGGRMPIVFAVAAIACTGALRRSHGRPIVPRFSFATRIILALGGIVVAIYVSFVLIDRAAASRMNPPEYTESSISYLRGSPTTAWTKQTRPSGLLAASSLSVAQLVHPFWLFELVRKDEHREGGIMLISTFLFLLQKLGFFQGVTNTWTYSGLYLSLPGAAYHDGGWAGLVLMVVFHSLCLAWAAVLSRSVTPWRLAVILAVGVVTVLSPLIPAFLAGPFPFMVFAFLVPAFSRRLVFVRKAGAANRNPLVVSSPAS